MVVANAANREPAATALTARAEGFDVFVSDESDDIALIAIQGPDALSVLLETEGFGVEGPPATTTRTSIARRPS